MCAIALIENAIIFLFLFLHFGKLWLNSLSRQVWTGTGLPGIDIYILCVCRLRDRG